ncbi:hypothetical protein N9573_03510 [Octadecabacter sp.]|nr:hypothetical protein [Octadecabacter sp.]
MRKTTKSPGEKIVKDIKRATRKHYSSEEKIRIVLDGLRGEDSFGQDFRGNFVVFQQTDFSCGTESRQKGPSTAIRYFTYECPL